MVLDVVGVLAVGNKPWDVLVSWLKSVGFQSDGMLKLVAHWTLVATQEIVHVGHSREFGALFGDLIVVLSGVLTFNTGQKLESLDLVFLVVECTGLKEIVLAFCNSVLAGEIPFTFAVQFFMCISIRMKIDLSHVQETFCLHCFLEIVGNLISASWAL